MSVAGGQERGGLAVKVCGDEIIELQRLDLGFGGADLGAAALGVVDPLLGDLEGGDRGLIRLGGGGVGLGKQAGGLV